MDAPCRADLVGANRDLVSFFALEERGKRMRQIGNLVMQPG